MGTIHHTSLRKLGGSVEAILCELRIPASRKRVIPTAYSPQQRWAATRGSKFRRFLHKANKRPLQMHCDCEPRTHQALLFESASCYTLTSNDLILFFALRVERLRNTEAAKDSRM